jgi:hypothetical protein
MKKQLFIPERLKVGFVERGGTYTGRLAYVIYYDQKGVLRKETSWQTWRDKKIEPIELENKPFEGFVLNKRAGGAAGSWSSWNVRQEYCRVWDPRCEGTDKDGKSISGFEFEITIPNLLYILSECNCHKGKGLEGTFVYAWDGTSVVLLPTCAAEYQESQKFTQLQGQSVGTRELIPGITYLTKKQESLIYVGRFDYYFLVSGSDYRNRTKAQGDQKGVLKRHVFWQEGEYSYYDDEDERNEKTKTDGHFVYDPKNLSTIQVADVAGNLAELVEKYNQSAHASRPVELLLQERKSGRHWYYEADKGEFIQCSTQMDHQKSKVTRVDHGSRLRVVDGVLRSQPFQLGRHYSSGHSYPPGQEHTYHHYGYGGERPQSVPWQEPTHHRLYVRLENGRTFRFSYNTFSKERNF